MEVLFLSGNLDSRTELTIRNAITEKAGFQWKMIFGIVLLITFVALACLSVGILGWTEWFHLLLCVVASFAIAIGVASTLRGMRYVDRAQEEALERERRFRANNPDAYM